MRADRLLMGVALAISLATPAIAQDWGHRFHGRAPRSGFRVEYRVDGWHYPVVRIPWAPPAPIIELAPPMPFAGAVWMAGYYAWHPERRRFIWVPGAWYRPPHRHWVWIVPRWDFQGGEWVFVPGYWQDPAMVPPGYPPQAYPPPGYPPPGYPPEGYPPSEPGPGYPPQGPEAPDRAQPAPPPSPPAAPSPAPKSSAVPTKG